MAQELGLEQVVDFPTRQENTLDLVFTSHPEIKVRCKPLPPIAPKGDHGIVLFDTSHQPYRPTLTRRKIFLWKKTDMVLLLWIFYVFVLSCVCNVLCASVYMCFVVTNWERADLLALVCGVFCEFVTFPLVSWVRCGT